MLSISFVCLLMRSVCYYAFCILLYLILDVSDASTKECVLDFSLSLMQVMRMPISSFSVAVCWFLGLQVSNIGTLCEAPQHRRVSPPVAPPRAPPSALTSRPTIGKSPPAHPIWPRFCFPWSSWWRTTLPHFRTEPLHPHANSDPTSHFSSSFILPPVSICLSSAGLCHCNNMQSSPA